MNIATIRKLAEREEVDYQFLISLLSHYAYPREKISAWLKSGELIRVKKGLYIFGSSIALGPYSSEVLANLIYGPSAISLNYALAFYGFIPERVTVVTSITPKRIKTFSTPIGEFTYTYLNPNKYPIDIELKTSSANNSFFIASPEKALCDVIYLIDKNLPLTTIDDINAYLLHDMRIDENALRSLRINHLAKINKSYQDPRLDLLVKFIKKWKT